MACHKDSQSVTAIRVSTAGRKLAARRLLCRAKSGTSTARAKHQIAEPIAVSSE